MTLTEAEKEDPQWWCQHHKQSVKYLVVRLHQLLNSDLQSREQIEGMLKSTLPAFADSVQFKLTDFGEDDDEVEIS